jgi:hypothetical protein
MFFGMATWLFARWLSDRPERDDRLVRPMG